MAEDNGNIWSGFTTDVNSNTTLYVCILMCVCISLQTFVLFVGSTNNMLLSNLTLYGCSCGEQMKDIMLRDYAIVL